MSSNANASSSSLLASSAPAATPANPPPRTSSGEPDYAPYTDDPEAGYSSEEVLQQQRLIMDDQDVHLDELSRSITRQRDISLQINDELDVHTGLLEGLDHDLDRTDTRLTNARRRLDRVAKGAKENGACGHTCPGRCLPGTTIGLVWFAADSLRFVLRFKAQLS